MQTFPAPAGYVRPALRIYSTITKQGVSLCPVITFVVATLAGSCLHFVYALWPNGLTALLAPVNESLWEHVKILY